MSWEIPRAMKVRVEFSSKFCGIAEEERPKIDRPSVKNQPSDQKGQDATKY